MCVWMKVNRQSDKEKHCSAGAETNFTHVCTFLLPPKQKSNYAWESIEREENKVNEGKILNPTNWEKQVVQLEQ